jgi:multiple sugar transport system ATP-binding protein
MRVELKKLHQRLGTTAVYVTHDQVEAMTLGDRVVVMKDGWVQQVGEPLELYNQPANRFVAGFIGSPAMNFAPIKLVAEGDAIWGRASGLNIRIPGDLASRAGNHVGRDVTLGIRPENLHVAGAGDAADHCFDADVEVVEQLGSEILLDVKTGGTTMVAAVDPTTRVKIGEKVKLALNPARLHLFDDKSEMAI